MSSVKTKIPSDVAAILARSTIEGNVLRLPEQLDRETYLRVDKALKAARGKWDRKTHGHVFPFDPRELIGAAVNDGAIVDAKRTMQFFETPDALAKRMVELARIGPNDHALEPSAGLGRIVRHLVATGAMVDAVEADATNCKTLRQIAGDVTVCNETFETYHDVDASMFDAVVMNPPFRDNLDIRHIRLAWDMLRPGGRLVAICSEGPFFRQDSAAIEFRAWLDEIAAETEKLPPGTFRESHTDVCTRLIVAIKEGSPTLRRDDDAAIEAVVQNIPVDQIEADSDQPRKVFDRTALGELAASIRANGLLQPITVRRHAGQKPYRIVAGERRFRAVTEFNRSATIRAIVIETDDTADVRVKQIIENDQRVDVSPLEQARSYQALMDEMGWTVAELASRIGKAPHRITERTDLLRLQPEYQQLLASGNLTPSQAYEMSRLSPRGQDTLFRAIKAGSCRTYNDLRACATALLDAEAQVSLVPEAAPVSVEDRRLVRTFESQVGRIADLLRSGIHDNQITALRKVNPHRAAHLADVLAAMQKDLRRIEVALRETAIQQSFLAA